MAVGISVSVRRSSISPMIAEITVRPFKNEDQTHFSAVKLQDVLIKNYDVRSAKAWPPRGNMTAVVRSTESAPTFEESCMLQALIDCYPGWRLRYAEQLDSGEFTGPLWGDIPIVADRSCKDLTAEQFAALAATALRRPPPAPPPSVVPGNALFESVFGSVNNPVFNQLFFTPDAKDEDLPF